MNNYIRLLENEVDPDHNSVVEKRIVDLRHAYSLIERAIELGDGSKTTSDEIIKLVDGEWNSYDDSFDEQHHLAQLNRKPLRIRTKLHDSQKDVYEKLLLSIEREIQRLVAGGPIVKAHELVAKFKKQHQDFIRLRAAFRREPWWNEPWRKGNSEKRKKAIALFREIEDMMYTRHRLATALIQKLRDELHD